MPQTKILENTEGFHVCMTKYPSDKYYQVHCQEKNPPRWECPLLRCPHRLVMVSRQQKRLGLDPDALPKRKGVQ